MFSAFIQVVRNYYISVLLPWAQSLVAKSSTVVAAVFLLRLANKFQVRLTPEDLKGIARCFLSCDGKDKDRLRQHFGQGQDNRSEFSLLLAVFGVKK
jgi:hypothetical protein